MEASRGVCLSISLVTCWIMSLCLGGSCHSVSKSGHCHWQMANTTILGMLPRGHLSTQSLHESNVSAKPKHESWFQHHFAHLRPVSYKQDWHSIVGSLFVVAVHGVLRSWWWWWCIRKAWWFRISHKLTSHSRFMICMLVFSPLSFSLWRWLAGYSSYDSWLLARLIAFVIETGGVDIMNGIKGERKGRSWNSEKSKCERSHHPSRGTSVSLPFA